MEESNKNQENQKSQEENETIDYGDFLTTTTEDIQTDDFQESNADPDYYRPAIGHKEAKNREYKGRGRFVPNVLDRNVQKISKYIFCLPNAGGEGKFYVDTPEGEASKKNIVTQAFFALREHESVLYQQIAKEHFSRKMYHWMLYQIMNDIQEPDLVGKVKILRFGKIINEKIEYESKADTSTGKTTEIKVHDPFEGKDLVLHINEIINDRNQKMTSYTQSKFDELSAISLDGGVTRMGQTDDEKKAIYEYLKENSPVLTKAAHKPWTDDDEERVIKSVQALVDDDNLFNQIYKKSYGKNFFTNPGAGGGDSIASGQKKVTKEVVENETVDFEDENTDLSKKEQIIEKKPEATKIKEDNKNIETVKSQVIEEKKPAADGASTAKAADGASTAKAADGASTEELVIDVDFEEDNEQK